MIETIIGWDARDRVTKIISKFSARYILVIYMFYLVECFDAIFALLSLESQALYIFHDGASLVGDTYTCRYNGIL